MSEYKVNEYIKELFQTMRVETDKMIATSPSSKKATEDIMTYVAGTVAAESRGYITTLYSALSEETLKEPFFVDVDHSNLFFEMQLDNKILKAYKFDINDLPELEGGINFREINRTYATAAAGVGTAAVGGILLGVLSGTIDIPIIGIIAGAVLIGLVGAGVTYGKVVPDMNKLRFSQATHQFLSDLETEMYHWVDGIVDYYNKEVEEFKKKCEG